MNGRLLILNNYELQALWEEAKRSAVPRHLLFGIDELAGLGWDVRIVPWGDAGLGQSLNGMLRRVKFPIPLGDLQQQRHVLRQLNECDVIYAACQTQAHTLSYLRAVGIVRRPIVCVAHHRINRGRLKPLRDLFLRWQLKGTDAFPSLSARVAADINAIAPGKSSVLPWGPDCQFYPAPARPGVGLLAVGRTGRDNETFGLGVSRCAAPAKIICLERDVTPVFSQFAKHVEVSGQPSRGWMSYRELVREYSAARALAIPLLDRQDSIAGLSTLADALGMGKAVVMTRHPLIDIDLEKLGIGRWVEPGDVEGWARAAAWFHEHPDEAVEMGIRARRLAEETFNSRAFGRALHQILSQVGRSGLAESNASAT